MQVLRIPWGILSFILDREDRVLQPNNAQFDVWLMIGFGLLNALRKLDFRSRRCF